MDSEIRILILEDNSADAELAEYTLKSAGMKFISKVVETEEEYLKALTEFSPDLILSDYDLPLFDGAKALKIAKERCPDVPFILYTGAMGEDRAIEILTSGATDYVMKNRLSRLVPAVERALAEAEEHKSRKQAEAELREAHRTLEERVKAKTTELNEAQRIAHIGSWYWDAKTDVTTGSDELLRIYGFDPQKQLMPNFSEQRGRCYPVEDWERVNAAVQRAIQTGFGYELDVTALRFDGASIEVTTRGEPVLDTDGRIIGLRGTVQDITTRKRAEEAVRNSERCERERAKELSTILDAVPTPVIIVHDPEATHMTGNRAASELLRIRHGEISLSAPDDVKPRHLRAMKDGRELRLDELPARRAAHGEYVKDFEYSLVFEDGETKQLLGYGTPLLDEQGQPRGAVHTLVDITGRRKAEDELREEKERFRQLFDNTYDAILVGDPTGEGLVISANPAACRLFGYSEEEFVNLPREAVIDRDDPKLHDFLKLRNERGQASSELIYRRKNGTYFTSATSSSVFVGKDGHKRAVNIIRDITERKRAEEALRESKQFIQRQLTEIESYYVNAPVALCVFDNQMRYVRINERLARMNGRSVAEHIGRTPREIIPRLADRIENSFDLVIKSGDPVRNVEFIAEVDGYKRTWLASYYPFKDETHRMTLVNVVIEEITERKRLQEALQEREERLRIFIENAPAALAMFDCNMHYLSVSKRWLRDYNLGNGNLLGLSHYEVFPEISDVWKEAHRRGLAGEVLRAEAERFERADGSVQWVRWEIHPWYSATGGVAGIVIFTEDVTELKKAEMAVHQQAQLLNLSHDAIFTWDINGAIEYWNKGAEKLYGFTREEAVGRVSHELLGTSHPISMEELKAVLERDGVWSGELTHLTKDGRKIIVESRHQLIHRDGQLIVLETNRDITDRKRAEEELASKAQILEELNSALKVLLRLRDEDKIQLEARYVSNVKSLITPYVEKLKSTHLDERQMSYLGILETNINEIISPMLKNFQQFNLTPREIQIAALINDGKSTKEIAGMMMVATGTIDAHRKKIRKKLGLNKKKASLQNKLQSLQE